MLGLLAGREGRHFVLTGDASLCRRPMNRVGQPLSLLGADVRGRDRGNLAPLAVQGQIDCRKGLVWSMLLSILISVKTTP